VSELSSRPENYDLAVVGSGIAGLTAALTAARDGAKVAVLTRGPSVASASYLAQGGVAAAVAPGDSAELHLDDTVAAGRGLCRESAARVLVEEAPARIQDLRDLGVRFDDDLGLEGGHSRRRVHHVGGADTGQRISDALTTRALAEREIDIFEGERVEALWPGAGVESDRREVQAAAVLLASGGYSALWARTTNPPASVGDGIELAYLSGAAVADLELVQFHPTALDGSDLLLSEALRGEGALLLDEAGRRFTDELAPRDVVAREVGSKQTALLDLRLIDRDRFPSLMQQLAAAGYDPAAEPVPVSPAAHYTMGGVATDVDGRTEVPGLYAAGECACTGVHGANRLASNSLLECLVFGRRAALAALHDRRPAARAVPPIARLEGGSAVVTEAVRRDVWEHAGLVRDAAGLAQLLDSPVRLARLVGESALARRESRGGHFRVDYPSEDPSLAGMHTVLRSGRAPEMERWS
jgi:L-aspartate oxidase